MTVFYPFGAKTRSGHIARKGASLIEAMAIVSVGAILTGVVVSGMTALFRYDQHLRANTIERDRLQLLAQQLRGDIRQASRCQYDSAKQVLTLERDDEESVSYRWFGDHVERTTEAGEVYATRRYRVPSTLQATVTPIEAGSGQLMRIRFTTNYKEASTPEARVSPDWKLEIQAVVGRDLRPQPYERQERDRP